MYRLPKETIYNIVNFFLSKNCQAAVASTLLACSASLPSYMNIYSVLWPQRDHDVLSTSARFSLLLLFFDFNFLHPLSSEGSFSLPLFSLDFFLFTGGVSPSSLPPKIDTSSLFLPFVLAFFLLPFVSLDLFFFTRRVSPSSLSATLSSSRCSRSVGGLTISASAE